MEHNYISWNLANWITIWLMAVLGVAIFGMLIAASKTFTGYPSQS